MRKINVYYLVAAVAIIALLKFWSMSLPADQPLLMLTPVAHTIGWITGAELSFMPSEGYFFSELNMIINRSCSGINFWCISFFILTMVAAMHPLRNKTASALMVPGMLIVSYIFTLLANVSRILLVLLAGKQIQAAGSTVPGWLHTGIGIFTYLFFLIGMYILADYLFSKFARTHEKFA